ncbi:Uncharacterised protein [Candidatus Tiddalikarchaeum anstoanum]|nr:Uncharacterised protein [Candidatus Tiddalikarchaeum anstoanum]
MADLISLIFNISWILLSAITSVFSFILAKKFWKTKQRICFLLIAVSMLLDLIANFFWAGNFIVYGSEDLIPYPTFMDILWFTYYTLLGFGVLTYWVSIYREIYENIPVFWIMMIIALSVASCFFAPVFFGPSADMITQIADSLYIGLPLFSSLNCIPLLLFFKEGRLSKPWLYMGIALTINLAAEIVWIIESVNDFGSISSNILYALGYIFMITSYWKLNKLNI